MMASGAPACFNKGCGRAGSHFPVIHFAPDGRVPGQPLPYRLEVPQAACMDCQPGFKPHVFITDQARAQMTEVIGAGGKPAPDFSVLRVTWHPLDDPVWQELAVGGEARFWY